MVWPFRQEQDAEIIRFPYERVRDVHTIGGVVVHLAELSHEELQTLLHEANERRDDAVLEAAIVVDFIERIEDEEFPVN